MADYLRIFATQADYDAYITGGYPKPNVSYIEATDETIFTNYADGPAGPDTVLESVKIADFTGTTFDRPNQYITEVFIPDGVTTTVNFAFGGSSAASQSTPNLEKVTLPSTLTTVGPGTFSNCTKLKGVDFGETAVTALPIFTNTLYNNGMFTNCAALASVILPPLLTAIEQYTFYGCTSLENIDIPSGVTSIGVDAFYGCTSLEGIDLGNTAVTAIGSEVFYGCTGLTSVILPSALTAIGSRSFYGCTALRSIDIPSGVTSIVQSAFATGNISTTLTSVTVRAITPPTLGNNAFNNRRNLVIYVPAESVEAYKAASGWSAYANSIQAIPA